MKVLGTTRTGEPDAWLVEDTDRDDAAVLRPVGLSVKTDLLVHTVDFITPVVDDPGLFGQVAAANALSDVYAMGGTPRFALNLVGFPSDTLPLSVLEGILAGGRQKVEEAGAVVVGGHTVVDAEPKYGLSVTGVVSQDRLVRQAGARPGDALVLTKALGTGLLIAGMKKRALTDEAEAALLASMTRLNRRAADAMGSVGVHAATDVTGFGLLAHAHHLAQASGVRLEIEAKALPCLPLARERAAAASLGGAAGRNLAYIEPMLSGTTSHESLRIAVDAQTSGGLLIAVPKDRTAALISRLESGGDLGTRIGRVVDGEPGTLQWV